MARAALIDRQVLIGIAAREGVPIARPAAGTDAAGGSASCPSSASHASSAAGAAGASHGGSSAAADDGSRLERSMPDEGEGGADAG
jgi:hypothetical protein